MSRKKAHKNKSGTASPSTGTPNGKEGGRSGKALVPGVQASGVVHPSRPALSNSSEFYDIAFKVIILFVLLSIHVCVCIYVHTYLHYTPVPGSVSAYETEHSFTPHSCALMFDQLDQSR